MERPASLTFLGTEAEELPAVVTALNSTGVDVKVNRSVKPGSLVRLEWDDQLVLGETVGCRPERGGFAVSVAVEHTLRHTAELVRLSKALMQASEC